MKTEERYIKVLDYFIKNQPDVRSELNYTNSFELLVAVILSAQCTDKRVNLITPALFQKFTSVQEMANSSVDEIYSFIKTCSYPNNKAKNLFGMSKTLLEKFNGEIPSDIEKMQELPGVGRKTANVIASIIYNKPAMAVDTHVFRVSNRIGLTINAKTPLEVEKQLIKHIPENLVPIAHHWLILHGRYVCIARKPKCEECNIALFCKYLGH